MLFFNTLRTAISSSQRLFNSQTPIHEKEFLQSIQRTHVSFTAHKEAIHNINTEQDISIIENNLLQLMQELQQFTSQCEQIRVDETQLFLAIKEIIHNELTKVRNFLLEFEAELPIAIQLNVHMKSILEIIRKSVRGIEETLDLLVKTFIQDIQILDAQFSKSLNRDILQNTNLEQLEGQRDSMHQKLQQAITSISEELRILDTQIKEHSTLKDNSFFTKIYEFREQLKNLSLLIHERVGISNLLILLSFQEELKATYEVSQIIDKTQHLEEELSPELKTQLSIPLAKSKQIIAKVQQQSQALDKIVRSQSQGFFTKLSKNIGLNIATQGVSGMYKMGNFVWNNASEFKLTHKYLKVKMEQTSSKSLTQFLTTHPEFKEYSWAKMILLQYTLSQKFGKTLPSWTSKFFTLNSNSKSVKAAQTIISQTHQDSRLAPQISAVNSFLMAVCISTVLISITATKITQEII